jgi:hypothetical protein
MSNEERWEYIRKCLNEPDGAIDAAPAEWKVVRRKHDNRLA